MASSTSMLSVKLKIVSWQERGRNAGSPNEGKFRKDSLEWVELSGSDGYALRALKEQNRIF
eukprot:1159765-Pelagomonas_calceolata.AAC.5